MTSFDSRVLAVSAAIDQKTGAVAVVLLQDAIRAIAQYHPAAFADERVRSARDWLRSQDGMPI